MFSKTDTLIVVLYQSCEHFSSAHRNECFVTAMKKKMNKKGYVHTICSTTKTKINWKLYYDCFLNNGWRTEKHNKNNIRNSLSKGFKNMIICIQKQSQSLTHPSHSTWTVVVLLIKTRTGQQTTVLKLLLWTNML